MRFLVTGGRSDIGAAILKKLAGQGHQLATTASNESSLSECTEKYQGLSVEIFHFDLRNPEYQSHALVEWLNRGVDGAVFNAAGPTAVLQRAHEFSMDDVRSEVNAGILGNFWLLQKILPRLLENKMGRLVFISSLAAAGVPRYPVYGMSKAAMEGLFLNLCADYGEFGITSNVLRLGIIETKRIARFSNRTDYFDRVGRLLPSYRLGRPDDVAEAIGPLLAENCYINGAIIPCAGGAPQIRTSELFVQKTARKDTL
jgi:acetoacetyl-CoA reductase